MFGGGKPAHPACPPPGEPYAVPEREAAAMLFDAIARFLDHHHLSPDPLHYAFAHRIMIDPDGALAKSVGAITDGGIRLTSRDLVELGGESGSTSATRLIAGKPAESPLVIADGLVAKTQMQVEGFTDMVQSIRAEALGFGRDLAASADAIRASHDVLDVAEVVRLTGVMVGRIQSAEARLTVATEEANELRVKLEEARDNARRDPLTDLPNRRAFEEAFAAQSASGERIAVAVCDIDRFKRVNDRFGHSVGDRVLKVIAEALQKACAGHLVARYGGEEFTILFSGVDAEQAAATIEDARNTVGAKRYRLRESDEPLGSVTFSAGLTEAIEGECLGTVFGRADVLLYAAKDAGRNQLKQG